MNHITPEDGVSGLRVLTLLVSRRARGDFPYSILPLLVVATLLHLQPTPDKVRSKAIGSVLLRILTKALLPVAITDSHSLLLPHQTSSGVKAGLDSIIRDTR